jgi:iron complex outermembrane receptor protein
LSSLDSNEVLAQAIPGYTASFDDLTTSGELLRGKRPQFFLDGVLVSTPLRDIGRMSAAMIDPLLIDHIEVVNGASAIEGLGGSGGMINYITKKATQEGVVNTIQTAMETQFRSSWIGWKATGVTMYKKDNLDILFSVGEQSRPMYYDARGNLEYLNSNGSYMDSTATAVTAKVGYNFGADNAQRVQLFTIPTTSSAVTITTA